MTKNDIFDKNEKDPADRREVPPAPRVKKPKMSKMTKSSLFVIFDTFAILWKSGFSKAEKSAGRLFLKGPL